MPDLTAAVDAGARAHFDRTQAERRDDGRKRPDGQPWQWEDLRTIDQHAYRSFVLPIVAAAVRVVDAERATSETDESEGE